MVQADFVDGREDVVVMNTALSLAGLHGEAALCGHDALKDDTLIRMLRPGKVGCPPELVPDTKF